MWRSRSYESIRRIGVGYQSTSWLARDVQSGELVTIKATDLACLESDISMHHLRNEQKILELLARELNRPSSNISVYKYSKKCLRVVKLIKVFHEPRHVARVLSDYVDDGIVYFVFEFIPGAPLNKHIARSKGLLEAAVRFYAAELIRIIGALHERGIIYRDLKASNIIVQPNGRLMLIDFGFSKYIGVRGRTRSFCGTLHAMPPEILAKGKSQLVFPSLGGGSPLTADIADASAKETDRYDDSVALGQARGSNTSSSYDSMEQASLQETAKSTEFAARFEEIDQADLSVACDHPKDVLPIDVKLNVVEEEIGSSPAPSRLPTLSSSRNWSAVMLSSLEAKLLRPPSAGIQETPATDLPAAVPQLVRPLSASRDSPSSVSAPNFTEHEIGRSKLFLYPADTYGSEIDWWGLGVLIYEMIFCRPPFGFYDYSVDRCQTIEQLARKSPESIVFPDSPAISSECKDLIINLLQVDKSIRLGVKNGTQSVVDHPWFKNFSWSNLDDPMYIFPSIEVYQFDENDF